MSDMRARRGKASGRSLGFVLGVAAAALLGSSAVGLRADDTVTVAPQTTTATDAAQEAKGSPPYFPWTYRSALRAPLPSVYNRGKFPAVVPQDSLDADPFGYLNSYQSTGPTTTATNAFFQSLGTNGRSCATCHQPSSAMSVSKRNIQARWLTTLARDPLFAPVDGANCPNKVPANLTQKGLLGVLRGLGKDNTAAHSLMLKKGLTRVFLPVPANADYTITLVSDPNGCNTDPAYNSDTDPATGATRQIISVYRRPLISANLGFRAVTPGEFMWDAREPSLESQAKDATLGHAQAVDDPTPAQIKQMVDFETQFFSAQGYDTSAGYLNKNGATGNAKNLASITPQAPALPPTGAVFTEYDAWTDVSGAGEAKRESIARGQAIFNNKTFTVANVGGLNNVIGVNPFPGFTCALCHNTVHAGNDGIPGAFHAIGVGGEAVAFNGPAPATDLPIFEITCKAGSSLPFDQTSIRTNDPGRALITGKCADTGTKAIPQLRGLAAHEPYFSDGSAATLKDVVNFYDTRFTIGLTAAEKQDLVNFLTAL